MHIELGLRNDVIDFPNHKTLRSWLKSVSNIMLFSQKYREGIDLGCAYLSKEESRSINLKYRKKDNPTNVLSFCYVNDKKLEGDMGFCNEVIAEESADAGLPIEFHMAHLFVHGILHIHGLLHDSPESYSHMASLEIKILNSMGFWDYTNTIETEFN